MFDAVLIVGKVRGGRGKENQVILHWMILKSETLF